jgi:tetratricopeptide (TPR) repeat protein
MTRSRLVLCLVPAIGLGGAIAGPPPVAQLVTEVTAQIVAPLYAEEAQRVRPQVGVPLQNAQEMLRQGKFDTAATQVDEAEKVANKTAYESFVIEQMRGAVARAAGDYAAAAASYEAQLASGRVPASAQLTLEMAIATMSYQVKDYPKAVVWITRYIARGGNDPAMRALLIQAYFQQDDYTDAAKVQAEEIVAAERAGHKPSEASLQLLAACQNRLRDDRGFIATMEKLAAFYHKPDYFAQLIHAVQVKPGFASDRLALDVARLGLAIGMFSTSAQYMDMAQRALAIGLAGEAETIIDKGVAAGILGVGAEAARTQRLKELVAATIAEDRQSLAGDAEAAAADGNALLSIGAKYVSYGRFDKGIQAMEKAVANGGLKRPEDARLHLGLAYLSAGQPAKAVLTLKAVGGSDGTADLAHLWILNVGGD